MKDLEPLCSEGIRGRNCRKRNVLGFEVLNVMLVLLDSCTLQMYVLLVVGCLVRHRAFLAGLVARRWSDAGNRED
jgi:hypothetical protein